LYFRIKVVQLDLPPLRARGATDIKRLARHFAAAAAKRHDRPLPLLTPAALDRLCAYRWPGNVRELENCLESAVVIMEGSRIDAHDLPLPESSAAPPKSAPKQAAPGAPPKTLEQVEREHILYVLAVAGQNRSKAAKLLGIGRNTLTRKLKKLGY
jgi:Nif-specific regulatory protein